MIHSRQLFSDIFDGELAGDRHERNPRDCSYFGHG